MRYENLAMHGTNIVDVGAVQINKDASGTNDAVRKSQAESIAATAVQTALVSGAASAATAYTSEHAQNLLNAKQDNLSVDAQYFSLVNNTLSMRDLGIVKPYKDVSNTTLAEFIADATFNGDGTLTISGQVLDNMTFIFLDAATLPNEKAYVYLGTNNGTADDFVSFSIDYNQGAIRSFFSGTGVGLSYTAGTGAYALEFGTGADKLGAQTIPVDSAEFSTVSGGTVLAVLKALEAHIDQVDTDATGGQNTANTRLDSLAGVTANHMGVFSGSIFADNQNIKQLLQACETQLASASSDRAAIRNEFAAADTVVQQSVTALDNANTASHQTLQNNIDSEALTRSQADANLQNGLTNESLTRSNADTALSGRLDTIEGSGAGSVAKAQADAGLYTDAREQIIMSHVNANAADIAHINNANIILVATVGAAGTFDAVKTDARDGLAFVDQAMVAGEVIVFSAAVTLLGNDFKVNDKLMARVDIAASGMSLDKFVYTKADDTDITRANIGSNTVVLDGSDNLAVAADSINRTQLAADVESDIDDKLSKTADAQTVTGKALLIEQSDNSLASSYGLYLKKTQVGSGALTGTARALLIENHINSNGSGNPAVPCYAHNTISTHYSGSCADMSLVLSGAYLEANAKPSDAITAIGSWSVATDAQLGVNIGLFGMAENAAVSNLGVLGYASTDGAGADRGVVGAITSQSLAVYNATRTADPFPYQDIAVVADAKYAPAGSKAFYAYGDVILEGGSVSVPSASADGHAINQGDIKNKQDAFTFDLSSGSKVVTTSLDLSKVPPVADGQIEHGVSGITVAVTKDVANSQLTFTASGDAADVAQLTSVTVFLQEYSCAVRSV